MFHGTIEGTFFDTDFFTQAGYIFFIDLNGIFGFPESLEPFLLKGMKGPADSQRKISTSAAQTVTTIEIKLLLNEDFIRKTMIMERHKRITLLFSDEFWVMH